MTEPQMIHGTVEMVSVEWIIQSLENSVDGFNFTTESGLAAMVNYKSTDSCFGSLIRTILEQGFRVPIVICMNRDGYQFTMGNGHHRLAAAILLVLDSIPVYWSDTEQGGGYMELHTSAPDEYDLDRDIEDAWSDLHQELDQWFIENPIY